MDDQKRRLQSEGMTELLNILDDVKKYAVDEIDSEPTTDSARIILEKFDSVYKNADFRHSYSILSRYLGNCAPDERDSIPTFLARVVELADIREPSNENKRILRSIEKLLDHIELECVRLNRMDEVGYLANNAKNQQEKTVQIFEQVQKDTTELSDKVKGFHDQSITILGIFSAVVVGFMAEMSMFASGFDKLTEQNVYAVVFYTLVIGIVIFDTLFMLIFFVAKIAGFSLAVKRHTETKGLWLMRTFKNYPYVYCFNIFATVAAIILYIRHS